MNPEICETHFLYRTTTWKRFGTKKIIYLDGKNICSKPQKMST